MLQPCYALRFQWLAVKDYSSFILAGCHVRASAGDLAVHGALILAGGHVRASAGALAVHTALILAGGHVRASAGALAVHTALIPRVCLCVCLSVRSQTPLSSRHESGPSLFLSTGKHPVGGQLPRVFFLCSAWAEQRPSKPTTPQKTFDFSVSFRQYSESNLPSMQWTREAKNRSFNVQTVK